MPSQIFYKDPDDVLDYEFDYAALTNGTGPKDWLASGETIIAQTIVSDDPSLMVLSSSITNVGTTVTFWLGGGVVGITYLVTNHITTSLGRQLDSTLVFVISESTSVAPVVPTSPYNPILPYPPSAVPLSRYADIILYDQAAFWGVKYTNQAVYDCTNLWTERQRQMVAMYLSEAQQEIEQYIQFFLSATWVNGVMDEVFFKDPRFIDEQYACGGKHITRYGHLLEFGKRTVEDISLAEPVNHSSDPALICPVLATLLSIEEIHIYLPGTDREITPSKITYVGGQLYIEVPRSRLVREELIWDDSGVDWEDINNFTETVDIKRVYTDPTKQVDLVRNHACSVFCASGGCVEYTQDGCGLITSHKLGIVEISPASYNVDTSTWVAASSCHSYRTARLYYKSGLRAISPQAETAIVRLAHSKMPEEPCGCTTTQNLWKRDRDEPRQMTRTRMNCPFGLSNGAWTAYKFSQPMKMYRGGVALIR